MKKKLLIGFILFLVIGPKNVLAQSASSSGVSVTAKVGEFLLSISGVQSKNASLVLTAKDGTVLSSTAASQSGSFSFSVPIKSGFSGFCLEAIDFARLGDTEACVTFPPATGSVTYKDLVLPPTLGISRSEIGVNGKALVFGYTMPNVAVALHVSEGVIVTGTADENGYYEIEVTNLPVGKYDLFTTMNYQEEDSLEPTRTKELTVTSAPVAEEEIAKEGIPFFTSIVDPFKDAVNLLGLILLFILALIILLIILKKRFPQTFSFLPDLQAFSIPIPWKFSREKKLHHWWFIGY